MRTAIPARRAAFTLVEVLIAVGIFFMVGFAVLEMVVRGLGAARALQVRHADVAMLASEMAATNSILEEGVEAGDFGDFYPHARWERTIEEIGSNGLFRLDFVVYETIGRNEVRSEMSILLHSPGSPKGRLSGGTGRATGPQPIR